MLLRDDEHMRRRVRVDVFERKHVLVLVNFLRGNLTAENAAEKAVADGIGHRWVILVVSRWSFVFHHGIQEKQIEFFSGV
jgi:hypothetical protein